MTREMTNQDYRATIEAICVAVDDLPFKEQAGALVAVLLSYINVAVPDIAAAETVVGGIADMLPRLHKALTAMIHHNQSPFEPDSFAMLMTQSLQGAPH